MATIVVIEDNFQNARMADKLLRRAGHTVLLAEDGEMGLTTVFESVPDIILIDLGLPDIDGQTVIGLVRQEEALRGVPIIAFTAWPPDEAHDMAERYGCDGVITKPINVRTFADEIGEYLPQPSPEPIMVGATEEVADAPKDQPTDATETAKIATDASESDAASAEVTAPQASTSADTPDDETHNNLVGDTSSEPSDDSTSSTESSE